MSSIVRHPITGEWVVLAPLRGERPHAFVRERAADHTSPADCPFCPGNEHETPPEIARSGEPWRIRVVPNRYPALDNSNGGISEVVIESRDHSAAFDALPIDEASAGVSTYVDRFRALAKRDLTYISVFKNAGEGSGQSIGHLHSQILGLPVVPLRAQFLTEGMNREPCVLCRLLSNTPLILRTEQSFTLLVPEVPLYPYEQWIVPTRHLPSFVDLTSAEARELAHLMQSAVRAMNQVLEHPPFNWVFHNSPQPAQPRVHWFLQIFPRITLQGGFELGTGMQINVIAPTDASVILREAMSR